MVNTGKPSGACGVCRERRIKCDETKPTCLKCMRSGRTCSGYSHGLKLRDQTQKTILKARRLGKPRAKHPPPPTGSSDQEKSPTTDGLPATATCSPWTPPCDTSWLPSSVGSGEGNSPTQLETAVRVRSSSVPTTDALAVDGLAVDPRAHRRQVSDPTVPVWPGQWQGAEDEASGPRFWLTIDTPLVEQARCYFLSNYVAYSPRSPSEGMFTFVPSLLSSDYIGKEHFEDSFSAVAIAAFTTRPNAGHAASVASMYYARGVTTLRRALGDKTHARSDSALASTLLLGFYEGIVNENVGIIAFNPHFNGAVTLLRIRGPEQFSTAHGTEMFDFVMQVLMRQYELSVTCTEEDVCRWSVQAGMRPKEERPHLTSMFIGQLRLQAARLGKREDQDGKSIREGMAILKTAQQFERLITQRFEAEDTELRSQKVGPPVSGEDEPVYPDWWTATRALNKHAVRLLLCHLIADVADWLNVAELGDAVLRAAAIGQMDIESIMFTIPYLCTWTQQSLRGALSPCGRDDAQSTMGLTHLLVIWPLYLTGKSRFATASQKDYIQLKLGVLAETLGVRHASAVAKYLKLRAVAGASPRSIASAV